MIFVATNDKNVGATTAFFAKNKKQLKEMGFRWISKFDNEQRAIMWVNENYHMNTKEYLYD